MTQEVIDYRDRPMDEALEALKEAYEGSAYTMCGAGGPLKEWQAGYNGILADKGIGQPKNYLAFTGAQVNEFASDQRSQPIREQDFFSDDLTILIFPWTGLHVGKLAMLKLQLGDRWFDDVIQNMRTA